MKVELQSPIPAIGQQIKIGKDVYVINDIVGLGRGAQSLDLKKKPEVSEDGESKKEEGQESPGENPNSNEGD